jgi:hypothetical protein
MGVGRLPIKTACLWMSFMHAAIGAIMPLPARHHHNGAAAAAAVCCCKYAMTQSNVLCMNE